MSDYTRLSAPDGVTPAEARKYIIASDNFTSALFLIQSNNLRDWELAVAKLDELKRVAMKVVHTLEGHREAQAQIIETAFPSVKRCPAIVTRQEIDEARGV